MKNKRARDPLTHIVYRDTYSFVVRERRVPGARGESSLLHLELERLKRKADASSANDAPAARARGNDEVKVGKNNKRT